MCIAEQWAAVDELSVCCQHRIDQVSDGSASRAAEVSRQCVKCVQIIINDRLPGDTEQPTVGRKGNRRPPVITRHILVFCTLGYFWQCREA